MMKTSQFGGFLVVRHSCLSRLLFLSVFLYPIGCVSQGTYDDLLAEKEGLEKRIQENESALQNSKREIEAKDAALKDAEASLQSLSASQGDLQESLRQLEEQKRISEQRVQEFRALLDRFSTLIDTGKLNVKIVRGRIVVELATDILFPPGSASLSQAGQETIRETAQVLVSVPDRLFQIEGHTDDDPIRSSRFPSNWELASARAITVVRSLIDGGMPPSRLSAASYGEYFPVAPNDSSENKSRNRRIEIVMVPDLTQLPGFEEMQNLEIKMAVPGQPPIPEVLLEGDEPTPEQEE